MLGGGSRKGSITKFLRLGIEGKAADHEAYVKLAENRDPESRDAPNLLRNEAYITR
jgi:hypothetical protein